MIETNRLRGEDQEPPKTTPWWKSLRKDSDGSKERKANPGFFEISSKDSTKSVEGLTESLVRTLGEKLK